MCAERKSELDQGMHSIKPNTQNIIEFCSVDAFKEFEIIC